MNDITHISGKMLSNLFPVLYQWHGDGIPPSAMNLLTIAISQPSLKDRKAAMQYLADGRQQCEERMRKIKDSFMPGIPLSGMPLYDFNSWKASLESNQEQNAKAERSIAANEDYIGKVFAASGLRIGEQQTTLDWALIQLDPKSEGQNLVCLFLNLEPRTNKRDSDG